MNCERYTVGRVAATSRKREGAIGEEACRKPHLVDG
jgi:hypothetical protein